MKLTMNTKWDEKKRPYSWEMIDFGYERCKPKPEVLASCTLEVTSLNNQAVLCNKVPKIISEA